MGRTRPEGARKTGNKHKFAGRNNTPSRQRYWLYRRLQDNKVKRIMRDTGWTRAQAIAYWQDARGGRRMK